MRVAWCPPERVLLLLRETARLEWCMLEVLESGWGLNCTVDEIQSERTGGHGEGEGGRIGIAGGSPSGQDSASH